MLKRLFGHAEVVETLIRDMLPEDVGRIDFDTLPNGPATGWIGFWPSASGTGDAAHFGLGQGTAERVGEGQGSAFLDSGSGAG